MIPETAFPILPPSGDSRKKWIAIVLCAVAAMGLHLLLPTFAAGLSQAETSFAGEVFPWVSIETQDTKSQVVGKRAVVSFTQVYTTDKRAEIGEKTLYIELRDGVYKIVRETFRRPGEKRHE